MIDEIKEVNDVMERFFVYQLRVTIRYTTTIVQHILLTSIVDQNVRHAPPLSLILAELFPLTSFCIVFLRYSPRFIDRDGLVWRQHLVLGNCSSFWEIAPLFGKLLEFWEIAWFLGNCSIFGKLLNFWGIAPHFGKFWEIAPRFGKLLLVLGNCSSVLLLIFLWRNNKKWMDKEGYDNDDNNNGNCWTKWSRQSGYAFSLTPASV